MRHTTRQALGLLLRHSSRRPVTATVKCIPVLLFALSLMAWAGESKAQCTGTAMGATASLSPASWTANSVPPTTTVSLNMITTLGSTTATITGCNAALVGATVTGPNVPGGTTITTACAPVTLSQPATATGTAVHTFTMGPYSSNFPPTNQGIPAGTTCSVCPSTFTAPVCANQYINFYACAGNLYTISMCSSASNQDFSLSLTTTGFAASAGNYGAPFDNDGCGFVGGPSTMEFSPQTNGVYRIRVFQNPCVVNAALCGTISITCSAPPPPPPNDEPCTAIPLAVPSACSYQLGDNTWATASQGIPIPGGCGYFGSDVWYSVMVPASGNLRIQTTLVGGTGLGIGVYTTPACNAPLASWSLIACNSGTPPLLDVSGLVPPNATVYVRVWPTNNISYMGTYNICAFEPTPPLNDLPCGAFSLATPGACAPSTYTTEFATNTTPPGLTVNAPTCGTPINNDVWFAVTVPPSGAFTVNTFAGTLTDMSMAWYRLSVGGSVCNPPGWTGTMTQIACNDDQFAPTNLFPRINSQTVAPAITPALVPGETIYIRVWPEGGNLNGDFSICATENVPPPNDDPCGAIPLPTSLSCNLIPTTNEGATLSTGMPVPPCGAPVQNDVWYSVVVPPNGQVEINTQGVGLTDAALALYQTSGGCAPANLSLVPPTNCQVGGSSFGPNMPQQLFAGLTPGATVYVRVWRQTGNVGPFNICARQTAAAPVYGCDITNYDSGGPSGNYGNNEVYEQTFCPVNPGDVVAIDFQSFSTQLNQDILTVYNGPSIASPVIGVFSGGALPPGQISTAVGGCLTIRFTSNASVVSTGWAISVSCGPPLPPIPTAAAPCNTTIYDSGGASGAYTNNEFVTQTYCPPTPGDVLTMTFTQFALEQNFDFVTIFNGPTTASPSLGTFTGSNNPGSFTSTNPSGCLTLRFTSDISIVAAGYAATLRCAPPQPAPPPPPPPSGICGTTVFDPGGAAGNYFNATNQNPGNQGGNGCWDPPGPQTPCAPAGPYPPPPGTWGQYWSQTYCPSIAGDAVTLNFTQFAMETGWDNVYIYNGPTVDPYNVNGTQFLSGNGLPTCGGPAGWCNQTLGPNGFTGTANPGSFTSTHPSGCITIAMTSDDIVNMAGWAATISCQSTFNPSADCIYALRLYDSFGDGWAGSSITVVVNGGTPNTYTVTSGSFEQVLLSFDNGDNVQITYNGWGYFPSDNYWTLDQVGQPYSFIYSAMPAVSGSQSFVVNCGTPPLAPNEDCPGATILCNNNPVVIQSTHVGSVGDLTPTTGGCLSIYERPGEWYTFRAGATSNMGFSIAPTGSADINFAVWGPFTVGQLPPSYCAALGAPKRCSFATAANTFAGTGGYNTGMGSATYSAPQYNPAGTITSQTGTGNGWVPGIAATPGDVYILYVSNLTGNNTPATLTWTGGVIDCFLPVTWLEFDATAVDHHVDVTWATGSEDNTAWFDVQRSGDGTDFYDIGRVNAAGQSNARVDYQFRDTDPLPGLSYYRLKQVDTNADSELSNAVPVYFGPKKPVLQVFPNPTRSTLYVALESEIDSRLDWQVFDAAGRSVRVGRAAGSGGLQQLELSTEALESGAYMLVIQQDGVELGRRRFVKH